MRAFLGIGLLGSNFVKALLDQGEQVHIWNRTAAKAAQLEKDGAVNFDTPAGAVADADIVHLTLKDDASVDEVLTAAQAGFKPGVIVLDHTTTSASGAISRTEFWKKKDVRYQHVPVLMGPKNARERTGFMLISGDRGLVQEVMPVLSKMTGKVFDCGVEVGKAASMKLNSNLFLIALNGAIGDTLTFARAAGISTDELLTVFADWNPGVSVSGRIRKIREGNFKDPSWELSMARKDAGLMMEKARESGADLAVIPVIAAKMDKLIEAGYGNHDWTIIDQVR